MYSYLWYFLVILLMFVLAIFGQQNICKPVSLRNFKGLDCSKQNLKEVLQNLDSEIQALDLSYNKINQLNENSFSRYSNLRYLDLSNNIIRNITPHGLRTTLNNLEILHLTNNPLTIFPYFPITLKELHLDHIYSLFSQKSTIIFPKLPSLSVLSLEGNEISKFPKLTGIDTTLEELNLRSNSFTSISVNDLAQLCKLKSLNVTADKLFRQKNDYCSCLLVRNWIEEFDIVVDSFECKAERIQCKNETLIMARETRNQCFLNAEKQNVLYIYAAIIAGFVFLLILIFILRRRCRKKRKLRSRKCIVTGSINKNQNSEEQTSFELPA